MFIDRAEPDAERRYKAIGYCRRYQGIFLLTSADGADLAAVGGAVSIRFLLTRSRLYSYRWS